MAAEHEAAGGVPVEAVGDLRPARQAEAQRLEVAGQRLASARARMHGQARGLVEHEHRGVAVEEARHYLFRGHGFIG
jgi:hypothetical protein